MSDPAPTTPAEPAAESVATTSVAVAYTDASRLVSTDDGAQVALFTNVYRDAVRLDGRIKDPVRFREAMAALYAVVGSDYRYVPKDRTAYLAYKRLRRETAGLGARQSQQVFLDWMVRNDPLAILLLDPVVSVHPDQVFFEAFSKDEGTYAKLGFDLSAFDLSHQPTCGTTNIDFSQTLHAGVEQMRSYRQTRLAVGREALRLDTESAGAVLEKKVRVPESWLRGFLQVQSAATLPHTAFSMAPLDLYNVCRHLRLHGDRKGQRRGLRVELVPGEHPRLVLEPWETVLPTTGEIYRGRSARVVRLWGRRRLLLVRRLLPYVERVDVALLGSGLPSFWVLRAGPVSLTLGLTGFTASDWSQAVSLDLLLPRSTAVPPALHTVLRKFADVWMVPAKDVAAVTGVKGSALSEALQSGCQQGKLMYDLAADAYRLRALTEAPLDLDRLAFRNDRERAARHLIASRDAVQIVSENRIAGTGIEIIGQVAVAQDRRDYRPALLLNEDGMLAKAECTCAFFRKQGLKAGPCAHLVALRMAYAARQAEQARSADARTVTAETRTFSRRDAGGEAVFQVTLDRTRVKVRWGRAGEAMRSQVLRFNTPDDARSDYFARVGAFGARGFLDVTAG